MIKAGQIREAVDIFNVNDTYRYVITSVQTDSDENLRVDRIDTDGKVNEYVCATNIEDDELLAEYPTWQEAVNSKEFNQ